VRLVADLAVERTTLAGTIGDAFRDMTVSGVAAKDPDAAEQATGDHLRSTVAAVSMELAQPRAEVVGVARAESYS